MKVRQSIVLCALSLCLCLCGIALHRYLTAANDLSPDTLPTQTTPEPSVSDAESDNEASADAGEDYIRYIDFTPTASVLSDALAADIAAHDAGSNPVPFVDLLALLAVRYGGDFRQYKKADLTAYADRLKAGQPLSSCVSNQKLLDYYRQAYGAVLSGMVGEYTRVTVSETGNETRETCYGLRAFSPIAAGYSYTDYDDFGASRSYGYKRSHLGHDLLGSVGTPIIAVESGVVTAAGWNQYGGWRIGITSFDGRRYYYYAHLRRDHPFNDIYEGRIVNAGEVIGYLGMTGYSAKENVNNIDTPHLHYGLQIIFDPSQKEGWNQIWTDLYSLTAFLSRNRVKTVRDSASGERQSLCYFVYPETPD